MPIKSPFKANALLGLPEADSHPSTNSSPDDASSWLTRMLAAADDFKVMDVKVGPMGDGPIREVIQQAFKKWDK